MHHFAKGNPTWFSSRGLAGVMSGNRTVPTFSQTRYYTHFPSLGWVFWLKTYLLGSYKNSPERLGMGEMTEGIEQDVGLWTRGLVEMLLLLPNTCNASWEIFCSIKSSLHQFMKCFGATNWLPSNTLNIGSGMVDTSLPEGLIFSMRSQAWTPCTEAANSRLSGNFLMA